MRDHIGGGFHRYSVDAAWRVPHFEKMLYDQAQLVLAYVEAAQASRRSVLARGGRRHAALRHARDDRHRTAASTRPRMPTASRPSTPDRPDAHKTEGAFYLWRADELDALLGAGRRDRQAAVRHRARAATRPSIRSRSSPARTCSTSPRSVDELGRRVRQPADGGRRRPGRARGWRCSRARLERPRPHLDDKVLTAWNGLMIAAFARMAAQASAARRRRRSAGAAVSRRGAARGDVHPRAHVERRHRGRCCAAIATATPSIEAYAEDYAYLDLRAARAVPGRPGARRGSSGRSTLQHRQDELFWDEADGGWFSTTGRDPSVLLRMKEDYDGAEPTASSVSVLNLLMLSHLVEDPRLDASGSSGRCGCSAQRLEQIGPRACR